MADTTSLAESSQAFFCAIADYLQIKGKSLGEFLDPKNKELDDFSKFDRKWKSVFKAKNDSLQSIYDKFTEASTGAQKIPYGDIEGFLMTEKTWYISSALIGKKLVEDITTISSGFAKKPNVSDVWYYRGDKVVMKNIEALFKIANKNKPAPAFGDVNKWSPADIYFATAISLKKQTNTVTIKKVNFDKVEEQTAILKYQYHGLKQPWKKYTLKQPQTRDLQIKFSKSDREMIKIRHDASRATMKAELESRDMEARGGSIGSWNIFCDIVSYIDKQLATKLFNDYKKVNEKYKVQAEKLRKEWEEKDKRLKKPEAKKMARAEFDEERGALSAMLVTNEVFPTLIEWLEKNKRNISNAQDYVSPSDRLIQELFKYITSRTEDSGKFIIAK